MWLLYRYQSLIFALAVVISLGTYGLGASILLSAICFVVGFFLISIVVDQYIWRRYTGSPYDRYLAKMDER